MMMPPETVNYVQKLIDLSSELKECLTHLEKGEVMNLASVCHDATKILDEIAEHPQLLGKKNEVYLQACLDLLLQLESKLNDQMNQWVLTMNFSR